MRRFLIWLSGARPDLLDRARGDKAKYEGVGAAILFTAILAGVSMTFALNTALNVVLPLAILAGAAWAAGIMQLDRWLVVSIQRREKPWQNLFMALPRLFLALLFGVVISTPLVLQVFRPEIEAKAVEIRQRDADAFRQQQQTGAVGKTVGRLTAQRDALQKTIQTGGDVPQNPEADPKIVGLRSQLSRAQSTAAKAYKQWQCQLYGPCKPTGNGPLAKADEQAYRAAQRQVNNINRQIEDRKSQLTSNDQKSRTQRVADAKALLPQVESQLKVYSDQLQGLQRNFEAKNRGSAGLLLRLEALDEVAEEDSTLNTARELLMLLITAIECLPVLVKLLLTFGPMNSYERLLAEAEAVETKEAIFAIHARTRGSEDSARKVLDDIWGPPAESGDHVRTARLSADGDMNEPDEPPDEAAFRWEDDALRRMPDGNVPWSWTGDEHGVKDDARWANDASWTGDPSWGDNDARSAHDRPRPPAGAVPARTATPGPAAGADGEVAAPADDLLDFDEED
ncbi:MAG TPA: DUF4407 domain-containing protein [Streptosporangiaceae bacterium]|nr:DUF4407 domain-containing protein [Streptosporangiaceae bacterium]